jgi:hypothetical protein
MIAHYELACNIDIMGNPRITASKGRFSSSDPRVQRTLRHYPGVKLCRMEAETAAKFAGGEAGSRPPAPPAETQVRAVSGIQFKPTRERGGRVVDAD